MSQCDILAEDTVRTIHAADARKTVRGEEAFRLPWELRSFSLGIAYYEATGVPWDHFRTQLVIAIDKAGTNDKPEQYYARWTEALEALVAQAGGIDIEELDRRTHAILTTPRDDTHQHAHNGPIEVEQHHDHDHDHDH